MLKGKKFDAFTLLVIELSLGSEVSSTFPFRKRNVLL